jgi:hypothetical protein
MVESLHYGSYIGVPLSPDMSFSLGVQTMPIINRGLFPEIKIPIRDHITIYYLGRITQTELNEASVVVEKNKHILLGSEMQVSGLKIIGKKWRQALVVGIDDTPEAIEFRKVLEAHLPIYAGLNLSLNLHVNVCELNEGRSIKRARKLVQEHLGRRGKSEPFQVRSVDVFYK